MDELVVGLKVSALRPPHQIHVQHRSVGGGFLVGAFGWFGHNHGHGILTVKAPDSCAKKSASPKSPARPLDSGKTFQGRPRLFQILCYHFT